MPHGPAKAVLVAAVEAIHGPTGAGGGGSTSLCGWPDNARLISGSGPLGPICHGVWQSWQPEVVTRYRPRATLAALAGATVVGGGGRVVGVWVVCGAEIRRGEA